MNPKGFFKSNGCHSSKAASLQPPDDLINVFSSTGNLVLMEYVV